MTEKINCELIDEMLATPAHFAEWLRREGAYYVGDPISITDNPLGRFMSNVVASDVKVTVYPKNINFIHSDQNFYLSILPDWAIDWLVTAVQEYTGGDILGAVASWYLGTIVS